MTGVRLNEVAVGDELPVMNFTVTRADLVRYAGASGDFNPIHWHERTAREVGLPGVIAHGMYTMGVAVTAVSSWVDDPGAIVEYGVRFTRPVPVDDDAGAALRISGVVASKDDERQVVRVDLTVTTRPVRDLEASPVTVLGRARVLVRLPA
ncbi:MAG: MaoC/PaaZ C-terminal domain-containing protein [Actinomycetota bacterium]